MQYTFDEKITDLAKIQRNFEEYHVSAYLINNFGENFSLLLILVIFAMIMYILKSQMLKK